MNRIQSAIDDLQEALKLETKCSMGDKYETGRAMLHLEFEKLSGQLEEYAKLKKTTSLISAEKQQEKACFGSVVKTGQANYFISIPAGELTVAGEKFYAVGANAPIARLLAGKVAGEQVIFNGKSFAILAVF